MYSLLTNPEIFICTDGGWTTAEKMRKPSSTQIQAHLADSM